MGTGHGQMRCLTSSRLWELVGTGQIEREFWELVGTGRFAIAQIFGNWSGTGQYLRSNNQLFSGTGGN